MDDWRDLDGDEIAELEIARLERALDDYLSSLE